jgi:hypothetical protein
MPEDIDALEERLGRRVLSITIDDETGQLELDAEGFAPWEVCGVAGWLEMVAHEGLMNEDDGAEEA